MRQNRVAITGWGVVSPFGVGLEPLMDGLTAGRSAVVAVPEWAAVAGMNSLVAARCADFDEKNIERHFRRAMAPASQYAAVAARAAADDAGLDAATLASGRVGVAFGSTAGSPAAHLEFFNDVMSRRSIEGLKSMYLFRAMSHTTASNIAQYLGLNGRLIASCVACATATQNVGLGFEALLAGRQEAMVCGGADEAHLSAAVSFALIQAASMRFNDTPTRTPRPFDRRRDGVVCGDGAGAVMLERLDGARARGARVLGEVLGFATSVDGEFIAHPNRASMATCMRAALADAGMAPGDVEYVNAHATGTEFGDAAEAAAIAEVFGPAMPVSSFKGHIGHTLAACGTIELIAAMEGLRRGLILPTLNLEEVDETCRGVDHVTAIRPTRARVMLKNSFALGGVNTALVVRVGAPEE